MSKAKTMKALNEWIEYDYKDVNTYPKKYGKYFVTRKDGKVHWETWNGIGWAYNHTVIVAYAEILPYKKSKHIHIPIEGVEGGHITLTDEKPPTPELLQALQDMAKRAYKMFEMTPKQLEQRNCNHKWKITHSGYCRDCTKCGKKE